MTMADDTAKFEAIAPTLRWMPKWVRENLSARAFWIISSSLFGAGISAGGYIAHAESSRATLERANTGLKDALEKQANATQELSRSVGALDTKIAVLVQKVDDIGQRVNEQQSKWDRVEQGAQIQIPKQRKRAR